MVDLDRLAREAGFYFAKDDFPDCADDEMEARMPAVQRFAQLVAEEAAKIVQAERCNAISHAGPYGDGYMDGCDDSTNAIRSAFGIKSPP